MSASLVGSEMCIRDRGASSRLGATDESSAGHNTEEDPDHTSEQSREDPPWTQHLDQTLDWDLAGLLLRPFAPLRNVPRACQPVFLEIARRVARVAGEGGARG
eukprot:7986864-Alexandrium_andersonii.AAC.1